MDKTEIQHIVQEFMTMLDTNRPAAELVAFFHRSLRAYGEACAAAQKERDAATLDTCAARYGDTPAASHTRFLAAAIRAAIPPPTQE